MTTLKWAAAAMLLFGGLYTGICVSIAVDRIPAWFRMSIAEYAVDFRRTVHAIDPLQPILATIASVGTLVFALKADGTPALLAWIAFGFQMVAMVTSITIAEPMNSAFRKLDEGTVPEGAERIRDKWALFHRVRTVGAVGMLALLVAAAVYVS